MSWREVAYRNIKVFNDTQQYYETILKTETNKLCENTKVYRDPAMEIGILDIPAPYDTEIIFTDRGTVTAAYDYADKGFHVAALNFADALIPGGYVLDGAHTQEENICRCSNLYASLTLPWVQDAYYSYNRSMLKVQPYYTDTLIYSPDVCIFRDDTGYGYIKPEFVDIITCPSAATRDAVGMTTNELYGILTYRLSGIIKSAICNCVEVLILGAWGCGAFGQDANVMAKIFCSELSHYRGYFKTIEFAIRSHTNKKEIFETVFREEEIKDNNRNNVRRNI